MRGKARTLVVVRPGEDFERFGELSKRRGFLLSVDTLRRVIDYSRVAFEGLQTCLSGMKEKKAERGPTFWT